MGGIVVGCQLAVTHKVHSHRVDYMATHVPDASIGPLPVLLAKIRTVMFALAEVPFSLTETSIPPSSSATLYSGWTKHTSCGGSSADKDSLVFSTKVQINY